MPSPGEMLRRPAQFLKGVGPKRAVALRRLGVLTVEDLLFHYPRAWEDRREGASRPADGGPAVLRGRVLRSDGIVTRNGLALFKAVLSVPGRRDPVEAVWFKRPNFSYDVFRKLRKDLRPGADLWVVGRAEPALIEAGQLRVEEYYLQGDPRASLHVDRIVPVYPATEGISQSLLRELAAQALAFSGGLGEVLPPSLLAKRSLPPGPRALEDIHFPRSLPERERARRRLAYEELLLLELAWTLKNAQTQAVRKCHGYEIRRHLLTPFRSRMGFDLTAAQKRAINEIFSDMRGQIPMTRLLQGDVGSGKTVVAVAAMLLAVENGYQAAFMAPTEILAEQHHWTLLRFFQGLPVRTALLTSRTPAAAKARTLASLRSGEADLVIGTHALLEGDVRFARLRLAVIDEQHRFGVRQRATLRQKGPPMDLLVMTATPIPRTLAMALYGDLRVSTLDEMPPGRAPTFTLRCREEEAMERIRSEAARGRQAYVVYPVISESSRLELKAAQAEFERLRDGALRKLRIQLLHGRLPGRRKAGIMEEFLRGEWDVLVATPVVEVGVDAPNATTMVIENADRFGLASLHQLRGRVGRGPHPSECRLIADPRTPQSQRRLQILCETSDGFRIGEEDLRLRGPGEALGTEQHGELSLRMADLFRDADLHAQGRADARELLAQDPKLSRREHRALRDRLTDLYQQKWHAIDLA